MNDYDALAEKAEKAGNEIYWYGAADSSEVLKLEKLLSCSLTTSFKRFLHHYGGGGIVGDDISGIEDNDATMTSGGTVLGATLTCRERFNLPEGLVVIYFHDDEVCWCIDTNILKDDESPVVSYNLATQEIDRVIAEDFPTFMESYLTLHT